jgi:undecaprenyl phosphate N,N'-diacetylbacillosamine 1-phosphate transferase
MYNSFFKRILDFLFALLGLVVLSPLLLMVTLALYFANQGKPFFFQSRPRLKGAIFKIIKFKTVNDKLDSEGNLLPDSERITKMGKFV